MSPLDTTARSAATTRMLASLHWAPGHMLTSCLFILFSHSPCIVCHGDFTSPRMLHFLDFCIYFTSSFLLSMPFHIVAALYTLLHMITVQHLTSLLTITPRSLQQTVNLSLSRP
jgi:hypothetical protein